MSLLVLGLVLFLGVHSVSIVAPAWRDAQAARNEKAWKGIYTLVSLAGFALLVYGYGVARQTPVVVYAPPTWTRHLALLLMVPVFPLLLAAYLPGRIKTVTKHPMLVATKLWAVAHLLANGNLAHVVLFGSFLLWGVANFIAARKRDRAQGVVYAAGTRYGTVQTVVVGVGAWVLFAFWLHGWIIGIRPIG